MITGKIEAGLHPLIALEIAGTKGSETLSTLVDTGFNWNEEMDIVLSADDEPSIGTSLLNGCVMMMNFIENTLTIEKPLPQS